MDEGFLIVAGLVVLSFSAAALAGFGATVIALTLGAHVRSIDWLVPRLLALNLVLMLYLVLRHRAHADWRLLGRHILPFMGLGGIAGFLLAGRLTGPTLKLVFGGFVVLVSARELLAATGVWRRKAEPLPVALRGAWMTAAGVIHGIYASGGPLLVYALARSNLPKARFRSTLAVVWLVLNSTLFAALFASGRVGREVLTDALYLLPAVVIAIALGEWGHARVDERRFSIVTQALLLVAGAALFV